MSYKHNSQNKASDCPFPLVFSSNLTSWEEPFGVLDDGLDDADDLQGNCRHHLCDVAAADREEIRGFLWWDEVWRKSSHLDHKKFTLRMINTAS